MIKTLILVALAIISIAVASDVIELNSKNFEHLTQASTGATTGDWLIDFYAPWCGHCKQLAPTYEKVAEELKGEVNVAKVDAVANRDLGTRFEIKGYPTIKLISQGQSYTYKGRRTQEDIVRFARGGYKESAPEEVSPPLGFFGEIVFVYKHAFKQASSDIRNGKYLTPDVILTGMPVVFLVLLLVLFMIPAPAAENYARPIPTSASTATTSPASSGESASKDSKQD